MPVNTISSAVLAVFLVFIVVGVPLDKEPAATHIVDRMEIKRIVNFFTVDPPLKVLNLKKNIVAQKKLPGHLTKVTPAVFYRVHYLFSLAPTLFVFEIRGKLERSFKGIVVHSVYGLFVPWTLFGLGDRWS